MSPRKRKPRAPSRRKTTDETTAVAKRPQPHGGALNVGGTPGNKGGGRPPETFRAFLARLRESPAIQDELERALLDRDSKGFASALKVLVDYDTDKPAQKLELTVEALAKMSDDELEAIARGKR